MDDRNWKNEESLQRIRESGHALAEVIADTLSEHTIVTELRTVAEDVFYSAESEQ